MSELRDLAAERTIKSLQKENEELKRQLKEGETDNLRDNTLKDNRKDSDNDNIISISDTSNDSSESEFLMEIEKILKIYSNFTGLKITPSPTSPLSQWHCDFSSRSGDVSFNFELIYDSELEKYQYIPQSGSDGKIKNLPDFLTLDILMTSDQMQMFFWRLLDTLNNKKK